MLLYKRTISTFPEIYTTDVQLEIIVYARFDPIKPTSSNSHVKERFKELFE